MGTVKAAGATAVTIIAVLGALALAAKYVKPVAAVRSFILK